MILSICVALFVALFLLSGRDILIASYSQTASDVVFLFCIKKTCNTHRNDSRAYLMCVL